MNQPIPVSASGAAVEAEIVSKGMKAPRVSTEHVYSIIKSETYTRLPGTNITVCDLALVNGSHAVGINYGSVSAENFNEEMGRTNSRQDAVNKIWPLEGYLLAQRLYERSTGDVTMRDKIDFIARICHEVNRGYCAALGDNSQPAWEDAPAWQRESVRMGVDLHLSGDFGLEASHISWMNQKAEEGWVYGPIKNITLKQHPCMVPFKQLPVEQQAKDFIFRAVVHALADS